MINLNNSYKLFTSEDSLHIHKTLGIISLSNFIYRYANYLLFNTMNLNNNLSLFLISIHSILSVSSLIFHIPNVRNPSKPMIYPEFRLHSILFSFRSIIVFYIYYYNYNYLYVIMTCYLTMISADIVTYKYNQLDKNGKTMRNMPFDKDISEEYQKKITSMHSLMQIGATTYMLGNIETSFSPLFAIQLAALLMTLVRKSIISARMWHAIYSLSLWINIILFLNLPIIFIIYQQFVYYAYKMYFFPYKINKYISWTFNFLLFIIYKEIHIQEINEKYLEDYLSIIYYLKVISIIVIFYQLLQNYKILFTGYL